MIFPGIGIKITIPNSIKTMPHSDFFLWHFKTYFLATKFFQNYWQNPILSKVLDPYKTLTLYPYTMRPCATKPYATVTTSPVQSEMVAKQLYRRNELLKGTRRGRGLPNQNESLVSTFQTRSLVCLVV